MALCRLCNGDSPSLVDSHIMPRSLIADPKGAALAIVTPDKVMRTFTGDYDQFLCGHCEQSFSPCDAHLVRFARDIESGERLISGTGELMGRTYGERFDASLLKRFGQTLLFRAHVTSRRFYSAVNVGPFFSDLRARIHSGQVDDSDDFAVVLLTVGGLLASTHVGPVRVKIENVNSYRFHLPGLSLFVKVDNRPFPAAFRTFQLRPGEPVIAIHNQDFNQSTHESLGGILGTHASKIDRILNRKSPGGI